MATAPAFRVTPGKGAGIRVDFKQDTFVMETARLLSTVGPSKVGTKKEKEELRFRIQGLFSDYMETIMNKKAAKTSTGAAADLQMTSEDIQIAFGLTETIKEAVRGVEIKSGLTGAVGVTISQVGVGTVSGEKRRFEANFNPTTRDVSDLTLTTGQPSSAQSTGLGEFEADDQQKIDEITAFFGEGAFGGVEGKEILAAEVLPRGRRGARRPTGIYLIPWTQDGQIDIQNISGPSIGNFVKNGKGPFAKKIRDQINNKMQEGLSFNLNYDTLKKGKKSGVTYAPKGALNLQTDYDYEMDIKSKKSAKGYRTSFAVRPKLNSKGAKKYEKITLRLKDSPKVVMKGFLAYAINRLETQAMAARTDAAKRKTLENFIGFFAQFEVGNLTPYVIDGKLEVPSPKQLTIRASGNLVSKAKITGRGRTKQTRGRFLSNVQLSAILQQRLSQKMPRYSEPTKPTPRYITGGLAKSFQIMANYRAGLMSYFNTPPAAGYVDQLNTGGWELDETLVEPTIRQITQQLFGRQFRVLRTQ